MKNNFAFIILLLCPVFLSAQFQDSFDDGNFSSDPEWAGNQNSFKINSSLQLQLNEASEGEAQLYTAIGVNQNMEWQFWVKLGFSPSDNNFSKVYLLSDSQNLIASLNGYYLKLGESGSGDAMELFRQSGSESVSICRGPAGSIASSFAVRIKITHDSTGQWTLMADPSGGYEFIAQDSAHESQPINGNWLGLYCKYTSSNASKFYFDDFYAGDLRMDTIPPGLLSVRALNSNTLSLKFSEAILSTGLNDPAHYSVDKGIGLPMAVERDPYDHSLILLAFSNSFKEDSSYTITVSGLEDLQGNQIKSVSSSFVWHIPHTYDVLIHEIMVDPEPVLGLPPYEYIELYNCSSFECDLTGWSMQTGSYLKELPSMILSPKEYVLLCDDNAAEELKQFGNVLTFSSLSLSNTGTDIVLLSSEKKVIHTVSYDSRWYKDDFKDEGGWSLEMIDANNPCGGMSNWEASIDMKGGTPGVPNSVRRENRDETPPIISKVGVPDGFHVILGFSESIDSTVLSNPDNYLMELHIESVEAIGPLYREVILTLSEELSAGSAYETKLNTSFCDCSGNCIPGDSKIKLAFPVIATEGDIILNEVLFNPSSDCVDFVEIFNRSDKAVDLKQFTLCLYDSLSGVVSDAAQLQSSSSLLFPMEYAVLSSDTSVLKQCYPHAESKALLEIAGLPGMSNEGTIIALALLNGTIIDWVALSEGMHYPLLTSFDGVSLERIHPDRNSRDRSNWHSAAESAGFATPTLQNSQFGQAITAKGEVQLSPEIFSPDNDGYNDNLFIAYDFSEPGYNAIVQVFNSEGILIKSLIDNELCGTSGVWSWDGTDNRNQKAGIGRYILFIQVFDLMGNIRHFKRTTVLGGYLK